MRTILKFITKLLLIIIYRVKVTGKENLPNETAAILCPNHIHALDAPTIIAMSKRKVNVLAKDTLFRGKLGKKFANLFGIYPIKRNSADIDAIKKSLKILKNNELLMIFPEGTRNGLKKGEKAKNGPVMLAIKSGAPIIPIGIQGSFIPFTKVKINIGKPILYAEYKDNTKDKEELSNETQRLMKEIIELRNKNKTPR